VGDTDLGNLPDMKSVKSTYLVVVGLVLALVAPVAAIPTPQDDAPKKQAPRGGKYAEFESLCRAAKLKLDEVTLFAESVRGNPNATTEEVLKLREMQNKYGKCLSAASTYMLQERFTTADRVEMQAIMDRILQAPPVDKSKGAGKDKPAS
jgi:hypothetical protein